MAFVDPLASFAAGQNLVSGFANQMNQRRAAQGVASGNYAEALGALGQAGDIGGVIQVQNAQARGQQRQRAQEQEDIAGQVAFARTATRALEGAMSQGQDPVTVFDSFAPTFQQFGATPEQVQAYRQALAANPQGFLQQVKAITDNAERKLEIQNLGNGYGVAIDTATGAVVNEYQAPQRPMNVGNVLVDPSTGEVLLDAREPKYQTIQNTDGSTSVVAIDQPAPKAAGSGDVDVISTIQSAIPGVSFNSGARTPEQNRAAGGAERSYHLRGQAVDIPPQQGRTPAQLKAELQARGVDVRELIDEGDHWHIAWGNSQQAPNFGRGEGVRTVAQGENRGLSPSQQRAEDRQAQSQRTASRRDEVNLRREFNNRQEVKDFRTIQAAYNTVEAAARNPSAAGDLSLIFGYMKLLDPGSVVREQEFANAQNAAGVPDQVRNLYNRALNGQRLNPRQRQDFLNQAQGLFSSRRQTYDQIASEYRSYAQDYGVSPERVAPSGSDQGSQSSTPRLRFQPTEAQTRRAQQIVPSNRRGAQRDPRGSMQNPILINPSDPSTSFGNVPRGAYFITPDGQLRGPKP